MKKVVVKILQGCNFPTVHICQKLHPQTRCKVDEALVIRHTRLTNKSQNKISVVLSKCHWTCNNQHTSFRHTLKLQFKSEKSTCAKLHITTINRKTRMCSLISE